MFWAYTHLCILLWLIVSQSPTGQQLTSATRRRTRALRARLLLATWQGSTVMTCLMHMAARPPACLMLWLPACTPDETVVDLNCLQE